ncbi:MAG: hypothetical protein Q9198_011208 [Flavoplaca austrocitrina]
MQPRRPRNRPLKKAWHDEHLSLSLTPRKDAFNILPQSVVLTQTKRHGLEASGDMMSDALNRAFQDLRSKHEDTRVKAAAEVYSAAVLAARGGLLDICYKDKIETDSVQNSLPTTSRSSTTTSTTV